MAPENQANSSKRWDDIVNTLVVTGIVALFSTSMATVINVRGIKADLKSQVEKTTELTGQVKSAREEVARLSARVYSLDGYVRAQAYMPPPTPSLMFHYSEPTT